MELGQATDDALALLQEDIRTKKAEVMVERPLLGVTGHLAAVALVITNLVANALKFMPAGTQPKIRIRVEQSPAAI